MATKGSGCGGAVGLVALDLPLGLAQSFIRHRARQMKAFKITIGDTTATFRSGKEFSEGEDRAHWTMDGLQKLIRIGLWERKLDQSGSVMIKPPTVEEVGGLPNARPIA